MRQSWTKQKVRDAILGLHKTTGKLNSNFAQTKHRRIYLAAVYHFGSWKKAVQSAGFRYSDVKIKERPIHWTKELVIADICELYRKEGKINSNFAQTQHKALYQRAIKRFGSWQKAVETAGFDYASVRVLKTFRRWTKEAIIDEARRRKENNLPLNGDAVSQEDRGLYHAARRYFGRGGWNKVLQKIGLSSREIYAKIFWTKDKVIKEIHKLHEAGTPLYYYFLVQNGYAGLITGGKRYFGSWKKTIEVAGLDYNEIRKVRSPWTKKELIDEIKRLQRVGIRLSLKATQKARADLVSSAINMFGSWSQAVDAACINYQEHCLIWSTKAWLRKLSSIEVKKLDRKAQTLSRRRHK